MNRFDIAGGIDSGSATGLLKMTQDISRKHYCTVITHMTIDDTNNRCAIRLDTTLESETPTLDFS